MELATMKDAFDKVSKKQKLSTSKTQELIDKVIREIKTVIAKIQSTDNATGPIDYSSLFEELITKLKEISHVEQLEASQKDLNLALNKYSKLLEKNFYPDISKAYRHIEFDSSMINLIITTHFYRQGLFDLGDTFVQEATKDPSAIDAAKVAALRPSFVELFRISEAFKFGNLEPALDWASKHHETVQKNGSCLELKLRQIQYVEILKKGSRLETESEALSYAKKYLAPFAFDYTKEVPKSMILLLWAGRLDRSPYGSLEIISQEQAHLNNIANELKQQFCSHLGQSYESPLNVVVTAGVDGLPTLLKLVKLMANNRREEWQSMEQLPAPIELGKGFHFHSIFMCPVLKEQGNDENPPMLMPCGHVISMQAITNLSIGRSHLFKCPFCPSEAAFGQCKRLHF